MSSSAATGENKRIAQQFPEDVATKGNIDLIDDICTEGFTDHTPMWETRGRENAKQEMEELLSAFSDFSATVEDIIAEGDTVAMRVTLRGTHEGEFQNIEPTGKEFEVQNMIFTRIEDGKIAERWVQPDMLGLMQQLGVVDRPMQ